MLIERASAILRHVRAQLELGGFTIEREIGRGGSGIVYAAKWNGRDVALKLPHDDLSERDRKRFLEEAELLARVEHPSVIAVLDAGALPDGRPYLAMPLLTGAPLSQRIERGAIPLAIALDLFVPLANAIVHLHERGLVHRDIKPENVFYDEHEQKLMLLDFGIAREIDRPPSTTTQANVVRGTPATMAPERFFGSRATQSSDVYELAVTFYAMLTGQLPWTDDTDAQARLFPRRPAEIGVALPAALVDALMEAMSTRVEKRPTARAFAERVAAIANGPMEAAIEAPRETRAIPVQKPSDPPPDRDRHRDDLDREPPASKARSLPPRSPRSISFVAVAVVAAIVLAAASLAFFHARAAAPEIARPRLQRLADLARAPIPFAADTASAAGAGDPEHDGQPATGPSTDAPPAPLATTGAPRATTTTTAPTSTAIPIAIASIAPTATGGGTVCDRLAAVYCQPKMRAQPNGEEDCFKWKAAAMRNEPIIEKQCVQMLPAVEKIAKQVAASPPNAQAMTWCHRVRDVYCSPQAKADAGGQQNCAGVEARLHEFETGGKTAVEIANEEHRCQIIYPGVVTAMADHLAARADGGAPHP